MDDDEIRRHLEPGAAGAMTARLLHACWPGGPHDRTERAALQWLRRWRPERLGAALPVCSCATGRCTVCN
jgi:hypothetical protein